MPFFRCFYHVIWATKNRQPVITPAYEKVLFRAIREKSAQMASEVIAINGTSDHIHIAVQIPPTCCVADWVKNIKGTSSRELNQGLPNDAERFHWQTGYGVLTFGARNTAYVARYIEQQKEHHAQGTIEKYLETIED